MKKHVKSRVNNNVDGTDDKKDQRVKRPFNKKEYRLKKYSNKYKLNQWEERRKKAVLRNYYKELDKEQKDNRKKSLIPKEHVENEESKPKKIPAFYKAKQEFQRKQEEKKRKREEAERIKAEREEALKNYKERKMQTYKKLSKKTKKGQPVMKDRLEMLLEKIQQSVSD